MRTVVLIPTRLQSKRFPNKPMEKIGGKTVIWRCYDWAREAGFFTYVVSGDQDIIDEFPGQSIKTFEDHKNGTERCLEAARILNLQPQDIVINVQGDIAFGNPHVLVSLSGRIRSRKYEVGTVADICNSSEYHDPNTVKVLINNNGLATYFSRQPFADIQHVRAHVGIYATTVRNLSFYKATATGGWEEHESLEQMRWLYHGYPIGVYMDNAFKSTSINVPSDIQKAEQIWQKRKR